MRTTVTRFRDVPWSAVCNAARTNWPTPKDKKAWERLQGKPCVIKLPPTTREKLSKAYPDKALCDGPFWSVVGYRGTACCHLLEID